MSSYTDPVVFDTSSGQMGMRTAASNGRAIQSVGSVVLGAAYVTITGCSITLPAAGTYIVGYSARGEATGIGAYDVFNLRNTTAAADIANSETITSFENVTNAARQNTCGTSLPITVAVATTIVLQGRTVGAGLSIDNGDGRTAIWYFRV
jgi:hypothetical protein